MKFKKTRKASIMKNKIGGNNVESFLTNCAYQINTPIPFPNESLLISGINEVLPEIVGKYYIYIYYNKLHNITKYDEPSYNELVRFINDQLNELKLLDNNFYNWFTVKLKNYSDESSFGTAYKILLYIKTFIDIIDFDN